MSDTRTEAWKAIPGAAWYEASNRGRIRSIDRTIGTRFYAGVVLKPREDHDGYLVVNITYDGGERKYGVSVARLVLLTHAGPCPDGMEACHNGPKRDNRYPEGVQWDTFEANDEKWRQDNPPKPKPAKQCVRCSEPFKGNGQRCHPCVVAIGVELAKLLSAGVRLKVATERVGYPVTPDGLEGALALAQRHGGYGQSSLQSVKARWKSWLAGGDAA